MRRLMGSVILLSLAGCFALPYRPPATQPARIVNVSAITIDGMPVAANQRTADPRPVGDNMTVQVEFAAGGSVCFALTRDVAVQFEGIRVDWAPDLYFDYVIDPPEIPGDVNRDGKVDNVDAELVTAAIGSSEWICDLDRSGTVDQADVELVR